MQTKPLMLQILICDLPVEKSKLLKRRKKEKSKCASETEDQKELRLEKGRSCDRKQNKGETQSRNKWLRVEDLLRLSRTEVGWPHLRSVSEMPKC